MVIWNVTNDSITTIVTSQSTRNSSNCLSCLVISNLFFPSRIPNFPSIPPSRKKREGLSLSMSQIKVTNSTFDVPVLFGLNPFTAGFLVGACHKRFRGREERKHILVGSNDGGVQSSHLLSWRRCVRIICDLVYGTALLDLVQDLE